MEATIQVILNIDQGLPTFNVLTGTTAQRLRKGRRLVSGNRVNQALVE